ncbi:unnamed protein product [Cochlearia groenlandica]
MGCVSSNLLNQNDDFSPLAGCHHHFVKLTSSTYGLLNLDPPPSPPPLSSSVAAAETATPMTPPERFTIFDKNPVTAKPETTTTEVVNFYELMSGLDADTRRFSPSPEKRDVVSGGLNKENSDPNSKNPRNQSKIDDEESMQPLDPKSTERLERPFPPGGGVDGGGENQNRVVIYTTSLRGVRRTFEACNAVRAAIESFGVAICERDVSMDRGFRDELTSLMEGDDAAAAAMIPPRVFVKGKYIGGEEEIMRLVEEGLLGDLLKEIPRKKKEKKNGYCGGCDGCGGLLFSPCKDCNGSCKVVEGWGNDVVVVRCKECNENGLVRCPICT